MVACGRDCEQEIKMKTDSKIDREELKSELATIIEKQLKDASVRRDDSAYWGGTSKMVTAAAWSAKSAIERSLEQANAEKSLQPIIEEVERAYRQFNDFFSDDDGTGAGTFADILRDIRALQLKGSEQR